MKINGTGTNIQYTALGQNSGSLNFSLVSAFVQATGAVYLGTDSHPYSFALWIRPTAITSGTIIHVASSTGSTSSWSYPVLGFTNTGQISAQGCSANGSIPLIGSTVFVGAWIHLAITYSQNTSLRLWINGTQIASSSSTFNSHTPDVPLVIILGTSPNIAGACSSTSIVAGQYKGLLDEFYLYSRELSAADILDLVNL